MKINALCVDDKGIKTAEKCADIVLATSHSIVSDRIKTWQVYDGAVTNGDIYLDTMTDETLLESACDYLITTEARAIVRAAFDLEESGIIEARYKLSPIMLLHKLGIISNCMIAGGVCLDNDDLDLMAQENVPLILLPTADAGYGHGFAPVCAAIKRGVRVGVGTYDGKYNKTHDIDNELKFLRLVTNAEMSRENSLTEMQLKAISAFE